MIGKASAAGQLAPATDRVAQEWSKGNVGARMYDFIVMHKRLAGPLGRIMWGDDWGDLYADIARLRDVPAGSQILDIPCGGGLAFRGLAPDTPVRYVAADVSPFMLNRARAEATRRGLVGIDFVPVSVDQILFDDATFDLCLSYNGLHCFPDPEHAVAEMARVLRPGGQLRGTAIVTGAGWVSAACIAIFEHANQFASVGKAEDIERWLTAAGIAEPQVRRRGAYVVFDGKKAAS
jgi:ubiquinone/menaquinone biosynthesis C-methylase UbiE